MSYVYYIILGSNYPTTVITLSHPHAKSYSDCIYIIVKLVKDVHTVHPLLALHIEN